MEFSEKLKKIIYLGAFFFASFVITSSIQAAGLTVGTSTLELQPHENLYYGITSATNATGTFLLFEKGPGNVIFRIDHSGNITSTGNLIGANNYWNLSGNNLYASTTSWNLGIGTNNPGAKLGVSGDINLISGYFRNSIGGSSGANLIPISADAWRSRTDFWTPNTWTSGTASISIVDPPAGAIIPSGKAHGFTTSTGRGYVIDQFIQIDPNITYYGKIWAARTSGSGALYAGYAAYDKDGNALTGNGGTRGYFIANGASPSTTGTWYYGKIKGEGTAVSQFPVGTRYIKPLILVNNSSGGVTQIAGFEISDRPSEQSNNIFDLATNGTSRLYIDSAGNIGIGTTGPATPFDVLGKVKINTTGTIYNQDALRWLDFSGVLGDSLKVHGDIYSTAGELKTDGTGINYMLGVLGVGTSNPAPNTKLNIKGPTPSGVYGFGDGARYTGQLVIEATDAYTTQKGGRIAFSGVAGAGGGAFTGLTRQDSVFGTIEGFKLNATANNAGGGLIFSTNYNSDGKLYERMRITDTGNVGIGTTNPSVKLEVSGDVKGNSFIGGLYNFDVRTNNALPGDLGYVFTSWFSTSGTSYAPSQLVSHASGFTVAGLGGVDRRRWQMAGDASILEDNRWFLRTGINSTWGSWRQIITDDGAGNVGINTTSPAATLDVAGSLKVSSAVTFSGSLYAGSGSRLIMVDDSGNLSATTTSAVLPPGTVTLPSGTNGQTLRYNNGSWVANSTIYNNGTNVGIGTSTPADKLQVYGNTFLGKISGYPFKSLWTWESDNSGYYSGIGYQKSDGTNRKLFAWWIDNVLETNVNSVLNIATPGHTFDGVAPNSGRTVGIKLASAGNSYFNGGNVGIGTTSPETALDIFNKVKITAGGTIYNNDNSRWLDLSGILSTSLLVTRNIATVNGYVGIGTSTPDVKLLVYGTSGRIATFGSIGASTAMANPVNVSFGSTYGNSTPGSVNNLKWDLFTSASSGSRYGIGMSSNLMEFQSGSNGGLGFFVNQGTEAMRILSSGNVGIGTNPSAKLDVNGDFKVNGNITVGGNQTKIIAVNSLTLTLPAQGTKLAFLNIAQNSLCKVTMSSSENGFFQPTEIYVMRGGSFVPKIVRDGIKIHEHSYDVAFSSDLNGDVWMEKVVYSTGRNINVTSVEQLKGTCTVLNGSTTSTGNGSDQSVIAHNPFETNGSSIYYNAGYVGIGTNNPLDQLHITGNVRVGGLLNCSGTGAAVKTDASGRLVCGTIAGGVTGSGVTNYIPKWTNSNTLATSTIYDNGTNVGIGTTNPTARLHVLGKTEDNQVVGAGITSAVEITNSYTAAYGRLSELIFSTAAGGGTSRMAAISSGYTNWNAAGLSGDLRFSTRTVGGANLSEKMRITAAGDVGIGLTNPANKLDVMTSSTTDAYVRFQREASTKPVGIAFGTGNVTNSYIYSPASSNDLRFYTGGDRMTILSSNGNVGIGTTAPAEKITVIGDTEIINSKTHVSGDLSSTEAILRLYNNYSSDVVEKGAVLTFEDNYLGTTRTTRAAIKGGTATAGNTANGFLAFYTDASGANSMQERMRINYNGNVGIGTTNPLDQLHVGGNIRIDNLLNCSGTGAAVKTDASGRLFCGTIAGGVTGSGTTNYVSKWTGTNTLGNGIIYDNGTSVGIDTNNPGAKLDVNGSSVFRGSMSLSVGLDEPGIKFTGSAVNYGDRAPVRWMREKSGATVVWEVVKGGKLEISSGGAYSTNQSSIISLTTGASPYLTIGDKINLLSNGTSYINGGNVGIGLTNPANKLDVMTSSTTDAYVRFQREVSTKPVGISFGTGNVTNSYIYSPASSNDLRFYTGGDRMTILSSNGNVGIGTTAPTEKLTIALGGGVNTKPGLNFQSTIQSGVNQILYNSGKIYSQFDSDIFAGARLTLAYPTGVNTWADGLTLKDGNIGLGTTSPAAALDIYGKLKITSGGAIYNTNSAYSLDLNGVLSPSLKLPNYIETNDNTIINRRFTMLENYSPQYIILCVNGGNNDVNGRMMLDRTSGHHQAASLDIVLTSNSSAIVGGSLITNQYTEQNEQYKLVKVTYNGVSYVAVKYEGWPYPATVGHFSGRLVTTDSSRTFTVLNASQVSNETAVPTINAKVTMSGDLGIGTASTTGWRLYVDGAAYVTGDISAPASTLTINKLKVNTIDPLYSIKGINYATFVPSIVGGVKEEVTGKIKIDKKVGAEYQAVIDFSKEKVGTDLWVWYNVIDFNEDNIEAIVTPYGSFANIYYYISDKKVVFKSNVPAEASYRLLAKRFDWRNWPTKAIDQTEEPGFIIK